MSAPTDVLQVDVRVVKLRRAFLQVRQLAGDVPKQTYTEAMLAV